MATAHSEGFEDLDFIGSLPSALDAALNESDNRSSKKVRKSTTSQPASPNIIEPKTSSSTHEHVVTHRHSISALSNTSETDLIDPERLASPVGHDRFPLEKRIGFWRWVTRSAKFCGRNRGLWSVLLSQILSAFMNTATRLLETEGAMPPFSVLFIRMGFVVVFCLGYMWWKNLEDWPLGEPGVRMLLTMRGVLGFFGIFGMFYSLKYLPLSDATVITFLAPSVAGYSSHLLLRYPFKRVQQAASVVALLGVLLVARPTSFFSDDDAAAEARRSHPAPAKMLRFLFQSSSSKVISKSATLEHVSAEQRVLAVLVALFGVLGGGCSYTAIKAIGTRAHPLISVNYFATWSFLFALIALIIGPLIGSPELTLVLPSSFGEWFLLFFISIVGFAVQLLLTLGVAQDRTNGAMDMIYTNMFWALLLDRLVFGTVPGWTSILGIMLILGSTLVSMMGEKTSSFGGGGSDSWEEEDLEGHHHDELGEGANGSESLLLNHIRV